jgi:PAS domain S-box-containing protein
MARNNRHPRMNNHRSSVKLSHRLEKGLEAFMDASVDAFLLFDENLDLASINPAGERMFDVSKEMVVGKNIVDLEPGIKETRKYDKYLDVMKTGELFFVEQPFSHTKFGDMHLSIKAFKMRKGLGMIVNDITERKRMEEALKESEERFRAIFDSAVDGMVLADPETRELYTANRMFCQMLGYSLEEIKNMGIKDLHPEEALPYVGQQFEKQVRGEITLARDIPVKRKDGSIFYAEVNSSLMTVAGKSYIMGMFRDITVRKKAEEALRESDLLATATIEGMSDGVMLVGMDGKVAYVNKAFENMLGYKVEELVGTSAVELPTYRGSKDKKKAREALKRVIEKGSAEPIDMIALTKDGKEIPINFTASVIKDGKGNPKTLVAVIRDITKRRKAEEELRRSEEYFKALMENSLDAVTIMNEDGTIRYESPSYERLLGFKPEERVGGGLYERIHPDDITRVAELFAEFLRNRGGTLHTEVRAQHKDGSWRSIDATGSNLLDNPVVRGIVINLRDITERKQAEEALRASEERYRLVVENANEAILVVQDGMLKFFNSRVPEVLDYPREEIFSKPFIEFVHPDDQEAMMERYTRRFSGEDVPRLYAFRVMDRYGNTKWVENNVVLFEWEGRSATLNFLNDITERKRAEEALRQSELNYRVLFDSTLDGLFVIDAESMRIILANEAGIRMARMFGFDSATDMNIAELFHPDDRDRVLKTIAEDMFEKDLRQINEFRMLIKDGGEMWISAVGTRTKYQGKLAGLVSMRDITERKQMEEELRRLSDAVKMTSESIAIADLKGRIVDINEAGLRMYGLDDRADLVGKNPFDIIVPEDQPRALENMSKIVETGSVKGIEYHIMRKDGKRALIETSVSLIKGERGEPKGIVAVARDITERRRMEEALRGSEEKLRLMFESITDGIVVTDSNGVIIEANERAAKIGRFGSKEAMLGKSAFELIAPRYHEEAAVNLQKTLEQSSAMNMEYTLIRADGSEYPGELSAAVLKDASGNPVGFVGIVRDITVRRKAEDELRESEERFRAIFDNSVDGILVTDLETKSLYTCNKAMCQMLGYNLEEIRNLKVTDIHPKKDLPYVMTEIERERQGESLGVKVLPLERKDGSVLYAEVTPSLVTFAGRHYLAGIFRDISERKRAEEALKSSEERYRLVVDNANEAIVVAQDGMLKFFNSRAIEILGYSKEEMASKPFIELIHPDDQQMVAGRYMARLRGEELPSVYSFRVVDKTGNVRWVEISAVMFTWEGRPATLNFLTDITERRKAEEEKQRMEGQLLLAGRLAAVGELSAGVAHELNNPIAAIQGFAQLLAARNDLDETTKNDLGIVYREAQRAAKITQNLLSFARRHEPEKNLISLNEVIEKTLELRAHQMKVNNIELVVEFAADLPKTMADFFQMQQVFVNIINNAEQAMTEAHGKGRLVVKTQRVGDMVQISFADDGPGIPEENMKRIFDPFFTTKEVGKGTGLGLSICYGLVEAHGGLIYARSKLGEGATFVVEIPIVAEGQ